VLWAIFMITGSVPLAWVCVCLLAPLAGLGMAVLLLGLPSPRDRAGDNSAGDESAGNESSGPAIRLAAAVPQAVGGTAVLEASVAPSASTSLPSTSRRSRRSRRSQGGMPVIAIAAHGVFITVAIMFVILAAIGAG
jgi:hypothetical protein